MQLIWRWQSISTRKRQTSTWHLHSCYSLLCPQDILSSTPQPFYLLYHAIILLTILVSLSCRPREAAMTIVRLVNNRNPHVSMLALALLETLVQSCGYAFHLQISTKEFLNELVRRFPERPPPFPGPVMTKILELIHSWKESICVESRWREDLGNIRDMHRLLLFKGYRFNGLPRQQPSEASTSVRIFFIQFIRRIFQMQNRT